MKRIEKVQKQLQSQSLQKIESDNNKFTAELKNELNSNPEFSLEVDPLNKYNMSETQKTFIKNYVEFKSIPLAAELTGINTDLAKSYFTSYASQQEIRRINRAMYQKQFSTKLLSIDEIGGYLSSLITDENVPTGDRVKTMDKVRIAQMLIDLQIYKKDAIDNPDAIMDVDIETDLKNMSVKSIKRLLNEKTNPKKEEPKANNLSPEEEAFLKTLSTKELLELMNETK